MKNRVKFSIEETENGEGIHVEFTSDELHYFKMMAQFLSKEDKFFHLTIKATKAASLIKLMRNAENHIDENSNSELDNTHPNKSEKSTGSTQYPTDDIEAFFESEEFGELLKKFL